MPRFCVLASGSSGNAAYLEDNGFGLLIDIGLGPRLLGSRLAAIGVSWKNVHAVVLTHVHTDHWRDRTLAQLRTLGIPLYCHCQHHENLSYLSRSFESLHKIGLVRNFEADCAFSLRNGMSCLPISISHDSDPTFAFRIDGSPNLFGYSWSLGYAADLGTVHERLRDCFQEVNVLALEFNHDEEMEKQSGRPRHLIDRVLGDDGHLSNLQAATFLKDVLLGACPGTLRGLVQLHLSRDCNRLALAQEAARRVLVEHDTVLPVQTATQDQPTRIIELVPQFTR